MLSFENTKIAFASKSNKDLNQSYRLFKLIENPFLVNLSNIFFGIALKLQLPIKGIIKKTIFRQFCGGESISDCKKKIEELASYNIGTILDYSVEGNSSSNGFEKTCNEIIKTIQRSSEDDKIPFAVFKLSGIAKFSFLEKINNPNAHLSTIEKQNLIELNERIDKICKKAFEINTPVFIDAEDSWIQDVIDKIATSMMAKYNKEKAIIYNTIQMYRHDRVEYLKKSILEAKKNGFHLGIKLVRGAYMEKERERAKKMNYDSPIQPNKISCDNDYNHALNLLLDNLDNCAICAGTHNEKSSILLAEEMNKRKIKKNDHRIYFAQLLGMSDHISFNLANAGYNVAKYVPYGPIKDVMPYLIRRANENTSVAGQMGRELSLIVKERKRRNKSH